MEIQVEILIPTYNSELYIEKTLDSIIEQKYQNWKILISDNSSTDNTCGLIEKYLCDKIVLFKQEKNIGPQANFNFLIEQSKASLVKLFCSDDIMLPWALSSQVEMMEKYEQLSVCSSDMILVDEALQPSHLVKAPSGILMRDLLIMECASNLKNVIGGPSHIMARGSSLRKCQFRPTYKYLSDMLLILDLCSFGYYSSVGCATYLYRRHSNSDTVLSCSGELPWHDWANFIIEYNITCKYAIYKLIRKIKNPEIKSKVVNYAKRNGGGSYFLGRLKEFAQTGVRKICEF